MVIGLEDSKTSEEGTFVQVCSSFFLFSSIFPPLLSPAEGAAQVARGDPPQKSAKERREAIFRCHSWKNQRRSRKPFIFGKVNTKHAGQTHDFGTNEAAPGVFRIVVANWLLVVPSSAADESHRPFGGRMPTSRATTSEGGAKASLVATSSEAEGVLFSQKVWPKQVPL